MELNEFKKQVSSLLSSMDRQDTSSKKLFSDSVELLRSASTIKAGLQVLNDVINSYDKKYQKNYINRVKRVVKVASIAVETKLLVNVDELKWYNIEKATKLMEHLNEYYKDDITKVKNKLNKLISKFRKATDKTIKTREYNDAYDELLQEFFKEYKIEEDDKTRFMKVETMINKLSDEYKAKLLKQLQAELIKEEEETK